MSRQASGLREKHSILCDDVRSEVGNKPSYMGVYTGAMVLPELPFQHPRLFIAKSFAGGEPSYTVGLKFVGPDGASILNGTIPLHQAGDEFGVIVNLGSIRFERAGIYELLLTLIDSEGQESVFPHEFEVRSGLPTPNP
jgi:hypothetical protein